MSRLLDPDVLVAVTAATTAIGAWFGYLRTAARERERTARLRAAIEGAPPERRSEIIDSCSHLEASAAGHRSWAPARPRRIRRGAGDPPAEGVDVA
jgi:hypothetical protein